MSVSQGSESNLVKTTTGIETNQKGLLSVSEDGRTTREGVFAGGDAVMGARTVVEAVAVAKKVAVAMDEYMKSLPADTAADPYAGIPVFQTPTSDVLGKTAAVIRRFLHGLRFALAMFSGKNIFDFGTPERLRTLRCPIFTERNSCCKKDYRNRRGVSDTLFIITLPAG